MTPVRPLEVATADQRLRWQDAERSGYAFRVTCPPTDDGRHVATLRIFSEMHV
jgi:hypothetical protein